MRIGNYIFALFGSGKLGVFSCSIPKKDVKIRK